MSVEVHIEWRGQTHPAGRLHPAQRGAAVTFAYADSWVTQADAGQPALSRRSATAVGRPSRMEPAERIG